MKHVVKSIALATTVALTSISAQAANLDPSYVDLPNSISSQKFYDGGSVNGDKGAAHIETFDALDFDIFTGQDWARLHESHDEDIVVTWPDGHSTVGINVHIEDLKNLFVFAPDTEISVHPVRIASGDWTSVIGVMTGTFTEPMPIGDGKFIQPTGKAFEIKMATIGFWQDGRMVHEWLFWDNATYMKQIGLGG